MKNIRWLVIILLSLSLQAKSNHFHQCIDAIKYYENKYNIPSYLLHSIAIIESGSWSDEMKQIHPWPWTVNVNGKSHYFQNMDEAVIFVENKLKLGIKNIDIGCNQVNWYHHGKHFQSVAHAFNPKLNSEYAAKFLRNHFNKSQNWILAVARYHSFTTSLSKVYASKVFKIWKQYLYNKRGWQDRNDKTTLSKETKYSKNPAQMREGIIVFSKNSNIENIKDISNKITSKY